MKHSRLPRINQFSRAIQQYFLPVLIVAGIAVSGTYLVVGSHAQTPAIISNTASLGEPGGGAWVVNYPGSYYLGRVFNGWTIAVNSVNSSGFVFGRIINPNGISYGCGWIEPHIVQNLTVTDTSCQSQLQPLQNRNTFGQGFNCGIGACTDGVSTPMVTGCDTSFFYNYQNGSFSSMAGNKPGNKYSGNVYYRYTTPDGRAAEVRSSTYGWGYMLKTCINGYPQQDGTTLPATPTPTPTPPPPAPTGPASAGTTLTVNQVLRVNYSLHSPGNNYYLTLQTNGNLVVYKRSTGKAIWDTHTNGRPASYLIMQPDGNLVLYATNHSPLWYSGTYGLGSNDHLSLQDDGNLVIYTDSNTPVWSIETGIIAPSSSTTPFYRLYNPHAGHHFYTASASERASLLNSHAWSSEGTVGSIATTQLPGTTPLYRLYNVRIDDHFYTTSASERQSAIRGGYSSEGVAGYIATSSNSAPGMTQPLYRLYNRYAGHFYTNSASEENSVSHHGYSYEGITGYLR